MDSEEAQRACPQVTLDRPPFWIVGAPRSGTTFLVRVLENHPKLFITAETRVMTFVSNIVHEASLSEELLGFKRQVFRNRLKRDLPGVIRHFYEDLGATSGQRWGDKYPHYADARNDPRCLQMMGEMFPNGQFIHILRDGRGVVASIRDRGWGTIDYAADSWRKHLEHARSFGCSIGFDRYLEVFYEDLVDDGETVVREIYDFLDVPESEAVDRYLAGQAKSRVPVNRPTTSAERLGTIEWPDRFGEQELAKVESMLMDLLVELGYESVEWRRARLSGL